MATLLPGNIIYGGALDDLESQNYRSLGHLVLEKFKSQGDKVVLTNAATGDEYTATYMYHSVSHIAHYLTELGVKSGDVIGMCSENRVEYAVTMHAAFAVNATVAPLNITYSEHELNHAINLSKPKIIFCSPQTNQLIGKVVSYNKFVERTVSYSDDSAENCIYANTKFVHREFHPPSADKANDVALIVCSSGTTGLPKGVQLTQANIMATLDTEVQPSSILKMNASRLSVLPWFHAFGCLTLIISSVKGAHLVFLPKFDEHLFLNAIEKYRVEMAYMVPPLMIFLAKSPLVPKYDLSSIQVLFCGAAPLSSDTENQIKERIRVPLIRQGYGLSETTLSVLRQNDQACKPGSIGYLKPGTYAKVVDPETGKVLGVNQRGELCFKGDVIMKGYIGDVKSTESMIRNGWLHTGDIGYYDNDLEFFIVDRIKELIKYKGFQVPPAELEALLLTNAKIKDAAVISKPDEEAGELPLAFVVKQPNVQLTEQEVKQFVAERTSPAKKLRGGVIFVNEIPKNPSGKILRRILRDMLKKQQIKSKL